MNICGLDLSLRSTGICILGSNVLETYRVGRKLDKKKDKEIDSIERIAEISDFVIECCKKKNVHSVSLENYAFNQLRFKSSSVTALAELTGVVRIDLWRAVQLTAQRYVATSARKKVFGKGKGRIKKEEVVERLKNKGLEFDSDDEADAFVIAAAKFIDENKMTYEEFWNRRVWKKQCVD